MDGHEIPGLESGEIAEKSREFIHSAVELLIRDGDRRFVFRLRNADKGRLVLVLRKMPINAVVTDIQFSADKPLPEGRIARIEDRLPALVPAQHLGVLFEALRKVLFAETLHHFWVGQIRLFDKFLGRIEDPLFFPMNRNLRFGKLLFALVFFGV